MTAAEYGRPDRWPNALDHWLPRNAAEPGTAAMPSLALMRHARALPPACMSVSSVHEADPIEEADGCLPETRSGDLG